MPANLEEQRDDVAQGTLSEVSGASEEDQEVRASPSMSVEEAAEDGGSSTFREEEDEEVDFMSVQFLRIVCWGHKVNHSRRDP